MSKTPRILELEKSLHGNKVKTDFITAPFTQIKDAQGNFRKIPDLANNLKASMGVERIPVKGIRKLDNEFGPSGEPVYETNTGDARIRFVGSGWTNTSNLEGNFVQCVGNGFCEITFYGNGLNLLNQVDNNDRNLFYSVDGGPLSGDFYGAAKSAVLQSRSYESNQVLPLNIPSLSLGIHTVRIENVGNSSPYFGFEILNKSTQVVVNPGQPFIGGLSAELDTQQLLDYSPAALTGTKGGRVVTYIDEDGNLGQAITVVDTNANALGSVATGYGGGVADHSNEEIVRTINYREFGRNRSANDDFSTLSTIRDSGFTLDDGTTTLVGNDVRVQSHLAQNMLDLAGVAGSFVTITFLGTGLDIIQIGSGTDPSMDVYIDGINQGNIPGISGMQQTKIVSGLPYGTHTVKLAVTGALSHLIGLIDFIIYQPKKPALPSNVVQEIADYNLMSDFVADTSIGVNPIVSQGIIRKLPVREFVYSGNSFAVGSFQPVDDGGFQITDGASDNGDYIEYTFFGTGFEIRFEGNTNRPLFDVTLNGLTLENVTNFPTATKNEDVTNGAGFNLTTGVLDTQTSVASRQGISISNLPLDNYTVRFTKNGGGTVLSFMSFGIITPIHINSFDLKTGSLSLLDKRRDNVVDGEAKSKIDWSKAKALLVFDHGGNEILQSHNISAVVDKVPGVFQVHFKQPFKNSNYGIAGITQDNYMVGIETAGAGLQKFPGWCNITTYSSATALNDKDWVTVIFFGELENEENIDLEDL